MDRNLLLAIILSLGVYLAWFTFVEKNAPRPVSGTATQNVAGSSVGAAAPATVSPGNSTAQPERHAQPAAPPQAPASEIPVDLPQADIKVRNRGMALSSYRFRGPLGLVELVQDPDLGLFSTWPELAFKPAAGPADAPGNLVWEARHPAGFNVRKEINFGGAGTLGHVRLTLTNPGSKPVEVSAWSMNLGPGLGTVESELKDNPKLLRSIGLFPPPEGRTKDVLDAVKPGLYPESQGAAPPRWLAVDNRYFLEAVIQPAAVFKHWKAERVTLGAAQAPELTLTADPQVLAPGGRVEYDVPFYLGPKAYRDLAATRLGLERAVNFGWFDSLGRYILGFLQYLRKVTGNYGWSIILLTMLIQAVLFPLTFKSLKATVGMRKIQPEIAKIQQKYKDDQQRLNMELLQLYKSKGVNPMGGCLPMLIQMPVFVALYNALRGAWELHGSPWIFWIRDLSAHDPFYILPLVMGGVMFFQNKMNPAVAGDPTQAQMMTWMPVIFTVMFMRFPAGLVLYWMTNSLMSLAQQTLLRKQLS